MIQRSSKAKEAGQLSIFLGISLTIIISLLAFIINVGLFVKAKINLQNAVDAAAWSGAAVQARQLTNIGYLNWEIRNTYKEWMFKYYVLGQLGIERTDPSQINPDGNINYRLRVFDPTVTDRVDPFNLPTICIHYGSSNNICNIYNVPGLPRFPSHNVPGLSQRLESFVSEIRDVKSDACVHRSVVNQTTAVMWTYGTGVPDVFDGIPMVLSHRRGAWPQALELAFRMRNLEAILNRAPIDQPICNLGQYNGDVGCLDFQSLTSDLHPINERPVKAFLSAYRNLSGGNIKGDPNFEEFAGSFTLTELPPEPFDAEPLSLSGLLIPDTEFAGSPALKKHYVDLLINPINYAIIYTSFIPETDVIGTVSGEVEEGACAGTKTALPVPAYITGFTKNTNLMTYYAVKGEANFSGLFYPFRSQAPQGIRLSAYAAAKPFGGRIGPRLFGYRQAASGGPITTIYPRQDTAEGSSRTAPYISGINVQGFAGEFRPGDLLPFQQDFWLRTTGGTGEDTIIGGSPGESTDTPRFGIPNMIYDFDLGDFGRLADATPGMAENLFTLEPATPPESSLPANPPEGTGLYNARQFLHLRKSLEDVTIPADGAVDVNALDYATDLSRRPTLYDALNFLIPTAGDPHYANTTDSIPMVELQEDGRTYRLYAPLLDEGGSGTLLYQEPEDLVNRAIELINSNEAAIQSYINSLRYAAVKVRERGESGDTADADAYKSAYNAIYPLDEYPAEGATFNYTGDCVSMAEKIAFFFFGENQAGGCNGAVTPIKELLTDYFYNIRLNQAARTFYTAPFLSDYQTNMNLFHTAYMPGPYRGATEEGLHTNPITESEEPHISRRNFYSTKFIPMRNVLNTTQSASDCSAPVDQRHYANCQMHLESSNLGHSYLSGELIPGTSNFRNFINASLLEDFSSAGFLDF